VKKPQKPKPSKKAMQALRRLASENRAPMAWYLSTDDPFVSEADTKAERTHLVLKEACGAIGDLGKRVKVCESHETDIKATNDVYAELQERVEEIREKMHSLVVTGVAKRLEAVESQLASVRNECQYLDELTDAQERQSGADYVSLAVRLESLETPWYARAYRKVCEWFNDVASSGAVAGNSRKLSGDGLTKPDNYNAEHPMTKGTLGWDGKPKETQTDPATLYSNGVYTGGYTPRGSMHINPTGQSCAISGDGKVHVAQPAPAPKVRASDVQFAPRWGHMVFNCECAKCVAGREVDRLAREIANLEIELLDAASRGLESSEEKHLKRIALRHEYRAAVAKGK
jgi:hypothetical protein